MLIHHIKPEQVAQLERMFAENTKSGVDIPSWLQELRKTPTWAAVKPKDFENTKPPAVAEHRGKNADHGFESISLQRPAHSLVQVLRGGQT
jgi:hypothetical protein